MADVVVCDVGPRDGLQNHATALAPATRAELCRRLAASGLRRIEAASFVHPQRVPQMAGAEEVLAALESDGAVTYAALVLNRRGLERAQAAGVRELHFAYPVTDTFAERNQGMSAGAAADVAAAIVGAAHADGRRATVTLGAAFGCPFEGRVDPGEVVEHARRAAAAGADEIVLADTIGVGVPARVRRLVPAIRAATGAALPIGLHLHNTRNTGYANAVAGLEHGVAILDASIGGLGGCPFAPRATGNIATEDLVHLLDGEGVETGVDLDLLIAVAEWLSGELGEELPGLVHRAG
jgi:isopropylmalate/homocitrate/citramalate synthase